MKTKTTQEQINELQSKINELQKELDIINNNSLKIMLSNLLENHIISDINWKHIYGERFCKLENTQIGFEATIKAFRK
jgi:uncharacterized protein Yka (UPF0111/DUF47 family)